MGPTETKVFSRDVSDDVSISAHVGYGRSVSVEVTVGSLSVDLSLEPQEARDLALALMDAATAAEK